jgi:ribose-phosphate pyrophosphokinase
MELLVGDVKGKVSIGDFWVVRPYRTFAKDAILVDDMIDTGTTLGLAANVLAEKGARSIYAVISHGKNPPHVSSG